MQSVKIQMYFLLKAKQLKNVCVGLAISGILIQNYAGKHHVLVDKYSIKILINVEEFVQRIRIQI